VHRPLGQQHQNGGADVATAAARTGSAAPPTALAGAEAESAGAETPTEAGTETRAETRTERPVVAGIVTAGKVAELATGLPALRANMTTPSWKPKSPLDMHSLSKLTPTPQSCKGADWL